MTTEILTDTTQFLIATDDETFVLKQGSTRTEDGNDAAIFLGSGYQNDTLIIKGDVEQLDNAMAPVQINGDNIEVIVSKTGTIKGIGGIAFGNVNASPGTPTPDNASLVNAGLITSTGQYSHAITSLGDNASITNTGTVTATSSAGTALFSQGDDAHIYNDGTLQGNFGIYINRAPATITLGEHSVVIGTSAGAAIAVSNDEATDTSSITNHGKVIGQGSGFALQLQASNDRVVNMGTMTGEIFLGAGRDVFDNRGGSVDHAIEGGLGDDTLITDKKSVTLMENSHAGYDTVKSTVGYTLSANVEQLILLGSSNIKGSGNDGRNDILGNSGKNHLFGNGGADTLDGGKGSDLLTGGDSYDTFIFKTGNGHDTITDFSHQQGDKIDLTQWSGIDNFADVKHHWSMDHGNLVISLGSDELILTDTKTSDVHSTDFVF